MKHVFGPRQSKRRRGASGVFNIILTAVPAALFYGAYMRYYQDATFWERGNYVFTLVYLVLLVLFLSVYGGYRVRLSRVRELFFSFVLASILTNGVIYLVMCLIARRLLSLWGVAVTTVVQWAAELAVYVLSRRLLPMIEPAEPVVYVGEEPDAAFPGKIDGRRSRFVVSRRVSCDAPWEELTEAMEPYGTVLMGEIPRNIRQEIISYCFRTGRNVMLLPSMTDILVGSAVPMLMGDVLIYDLNTQGTTTAYEVAKRGLDILVSALGLVIFSPVMLCTALAVKLQDGGPVFYRQVRLTRGGREFMLTKFRSMVVGAEDATGAVQAKKDDERVTKVGRFIRSTRLDELPQLWNVLKGDMTLVGPRPERPEFYEKICAEYPEFDYRLKMKAGLTGYAQLYGKYNTPFADKVRLDMYYIQHASFGMDLLLILYTVKIIFIPESAEGVNTPPEDAEGAAGNGDAVPGDAEKSGSATADSRR